MRTAGYTQHWGPGRHVLGSNYFDYVKDSFGQWWEYRAHIDYIEKDVEWKVANFADEDSLYLWGPDMPEDFPVNVESSGLAADAAAGNEHLRRSIAGAAPVVKSEPRRMDARIFRAEPMDLRAHLLQVPSKGALHL